MSSPLKSSAVLRIEFVLLASYKILLDFARVHATTLLQLASRTAEFNLIRPSKQ